MAPTSAQILAARDDTDLRQRIIALASLEPEIDHAASWVEDRIFKLAAAPLADTGNDTIASVLEYARHEYRPYGPNPQRPGENPGAVTDDHIRTAITTVLDEDTPPTE